ncbi:ABC transporter permease [Treponema denticola]|uniref:ABC transporter permease n=1 Tax=Treponema denticola TaxID=158 RepID=UPI0001FD3CCD|nr:ABC transporter permease [Treponema denticola]EGC77027.1 oligopeptide/dipeptide ABC transporter [Treponema denticola F0402]
MFARLIYGGRTSLMVGVISTFISLSIGVPLGLIAGYYKKIWEVFIMRLGDIFLSFPSIILILVLVSVIGPSIWSVTIVLGVLQWTVFARLIYANVLSIKEKEYIEAAKSIGTSNFSIILKYILPNAFPPILITVTFNVARAILSESALSFLGMGVQPPKASWGNMLYDAQSITVLSRYYWVWLPPGLCIVLTVLSINFFGDGIRDALDPRLKIQVK